MSSGPDEQRASISGALATVSGPALADTQASVPGHPLPGLDPAVAATVASQPGEAASPLSLEGSTLHHFKVGTLLGRGGMGAVYRAHDQSLDRPVALKIISTAQTADQAQRDRFVREARSQARLSHAHVVPIYYVGEQQGLLFFAMELVAGEALDAGLRRGERLPWTRALELMVDVAEALDLAHKRGIVHRDIKPSNLLVDETGHVKVADFGLAKQTEGDQQLTQQGEVLGSPLYMSPEQAQGEATDHRSDIYSLGATFYHLVTGRPPFEAKTAVGVIAKHLSAPLPPLRSLAPDVPPAFAAVIERALAKEPGQRFPDYRAVLDALGAARPGVIARAGFFVRAAAVVVDVLLLSALAPFLHHAIWIVAAAYLFLGWWRYGATIGQWLFRLRVRTLEGGRLTLPTAFFRVLAIHWAPFAMAAVAVVQYLVLGTWNAEIESTSGGARQFLVREGPKILFMIVYLALLVAWLVGFVWAGVKRDKLAWHDLASRTQVIYLLPSG